MQIKEIQNIDSFKCAWRYLTPMPLWSQAMNTLSLSITFSVLKYNVNGMSLYNKSFNNQEIFTSYWPSSWLGKYMTSAPSKTQVTMVWLICQHVWLSLLQLDCSKYFALQRKLESQKQQKKSAWTPLPPLSLKCDTPIVQNNQNRTHQRKKRKENSNLNLLIWDNLGVPQN